MNVSTTLLALIVLTVGQSVAHAVDDKDYNAIIREYPRLAGELVGIGKHCRFKRTTTSDRHPEVVLDEVVREFLFSYTRSVEDLENALRVYRDEQSRIARELQDLTPIESEVLGMTCERFGDLVIVLRKRIQIAASLKVPPGERWGSGESYWDPDDLESIAVARDRIEARNQAAMEQVKIEQESRQEHEQSAIDAMASMLGLIMQKVTRNWIEPPGATEGLDVLLAVSVTRTGEVVSAQVERSSGNQRFDDSAVRAVLKASPLPFPADPKYYEYISRFKLAFKPRG